jgi:hypothetical protein
LAIWSLRKRWDRNEKTAKRLATVAGWIDDFGGWGAVEKRLLDSSVAYGDLPLAAVRECTIEYGRDYADIPF